VSDPAARALTYDWAGNLLQGYTPAGYPCTAAYDARNRLADVSYTDGGGTVNHTKYSYWGDILQQKTNYRNGVNIGETRYVFDAQGRINQERNWWDQVTNEYTYGLGLPGGIGGLLQVNQSRAVYYYLYDGQGNVTALLDGVGNVVQTYQYDPFGVQMAASGSVNQPMRFSTKPYDENTGLYFYGYRFYNPALGRWMTRDPLGEEVGINLYGFVGNNPVNFIDPLGLMEGSTALRISTLGFGFGLQFVPGGQLFGAAIIAGTLLTIPGDTTIPYKSLEDYPANPDDWIPPPGWEETPAGEKSGGRHRQWKGPCGEWRRWDREGREVGKERGPHWHDWRNPGDHIDPTR